MTDKEKQGLIDEHRYINVEFDSDWCDPIREEWKDKLQALGYEDATLYYTGFCSQGDGASFECRLDLHKITKRLWPELTDEQVGALCDDAYTRIERQGRYYHENTMRFEGEHYGVFSWPWDEADCPLEEIAIRERLNSDLLEKVAEEMDKAVLEEAKDLARGYYRELKEEYEYLTSDEAVWEAIEANDLASV